MKARRHHLYQAVALGAAALIMAACSSSGSSKTGTTTTPNTGTVKSGGQLTMALDEDIAGFNPNQATDNEFVLAEILDQIYPKTYNFNPNLTLALDTDVVTSAKLTSTSPQTVVYQINPKAVWSDGVPISADDFIYNWQAQSGSTKYKDVGGAAYAAASTSGYNLVKSVTGSNNGKTVTVVFSSPYSDWQSMWSGNNPLLPAHIVSKAGFNSGLQNFGPAVQVSGGPYMIQSYTKGTSLVEVRNPKWWGTPGKLDKIIFRFILSDAQTPAAVANGEVNMINPVIPSTPYLDSVKAVPNFTVDTIGGLDFQHLDFNEANPYLALHSVRQALAYGTDRQQMIQRLVAPIDPHIGLLNNHFFMPIQPQYKDEANGAGAFNPSAAKQLLQSAGMTMGSDGYYHPNFGPEKGQDLTLSISTTSGVEVRQELEELFQADMKSIGVKINIQNYSANTLFGTIGPKSEYQIIEFAWVLSPFADGNQSIYCSYTNAALCGQNWNHYADPKFDSLMTQALGNVDPTQAAALYNQADAVLWNDMDTLPLFEEPQLWGWSSKYGNIDPNPSNFGLTWNANMWGSKAS